jgi:predicted DCC family thiol-disulfide oxidoreductase YuxK
MFTNISTMNDSTTQASPLGQGIHLALYDGACGLCNHIVQFVLAADHRAVFDFASLQSVAGRAIVERAGKNPDELNSFYVVANYRTPESQVITKGRAVLFVAGELGWPWKLATLMRALPTGVLDAAYDLVARNRYRIFGRRDQCSVRAVSAETVSSATRRLR